MTTGTDTTTAASLDQKQTWLDVLGILSYVYGGFLVAALVVGFVFLSAVFGSAGFADEVSPGVFLPMAMASFALLFGLALGIANLFAGRWLRDRRNWVGALVVAAINCLNVPVGTLLGVFTIVVLSADDTKRLFSGAPAVSPAPAPPRAQHMPPA